MHSKVNQPFFSIIIPTKNRAEYLKIALISIANQSFDSYELIVVDNDDTDQTHQVCQEIENPKMKYLRTGSLSMVDNWSYGIDYAKGAWVIFLEDKQALYPDSLRLIEQTIRLYKVDTALVFDGDFFNDTQFDGFGTVNQKPYTGGVIFTSSVKLLEEYEKNLLATRGRVDLGGFIPLPHCSAVKMELIKETKQKFGEYFSFCALDFTSAIAKLLICKGVFRIDLGLFLITTMKVSNGLFTAAYREKSHEQNISTANLAYKTVLKSLPFPELSMTNIFLVDYIILRKRYDAEFSYNVNNEQYLKCIFKDIYNIHAVSRRVPLFASIQKFCCALKKSDITMSRKVLVAIFAINHFMTTNIYVYALNLKHWIDRLRFKKGMGYRSPHEYIKHKDLALFQIKN